MCMVSSIFSGHNEKKICLAFFDKLCKNIFFCDCHIVTLETVIIDLGSFFWINLVSLELDMNALLSRKIETIIFVMTR